MEEAQSNMKCSGQCTQTSQAMMLAQLLTRPVACRAGRCMLEVNLPVIHRFTEQIKGCCMVAQSWARC